MLKEKQVFSRLTSQLLGALLVSVSALPMAQAQLLPEEYLSRNIHERVNGHAILPLKQILGIGSRYRGMEVESVHVTASSDFGHALAQVLVNRRVATPSQTVDRFNRELVFRIDPRDATLGDDINGLQLEVNGSATVTRVAVRLRRGRQDNTPDSIRRVIHQQIIGRATLDVRNILGLHGAHSGKDVEQVILTARAEAGQGLAEVLVDGRSVAPRQEITGHGRDIVFNLLGNRNRLDQDIRTLQIEIKGRVLVTAVGVKMGRAGRPPIPDLRERVSRQVNRQFDGANTLHLLQLMPELMNQHRGKRVIAVELDATTDFGNGVAHLEINGRDVSGPVNVDRNRATTVVLRPGNHDRNQLGLDIRTMQVELRGRFNIRGVTVILSR